MGKTDIVKQTLMRISEVAKAAGVSLPTIHYYTREGLLSPLLKTAPNMAYYSPDCVEDIRLIKELQSEKFLPLSVIKLILQARRDGQDIEHLGEMRTLLDDVFQPVVTGEPNPLTAGELLNASGLSAPELKGLQSMGLLVPRKTAKGDVYDDIDLRVAGIIKELAGFGLELNDLGIYSRYIEVIRNEADEIHNKIHHMRGMDKVPVARLFSTLNSLKAYLATKVYRQALEMHQQDMDKKEG
ncbi:MerR family transcriptional regulator [Dehalococcoides mccartyi]|uniref:MerR family transcriptional regulator n=1 Tax=Dehalococcoides mccartyi TaxID=61435 RepID=UPI00098F7925|nr:MerR family transcriptional regulator [Dehalococcoides mccartyi]AQU03702.1 MerR family transcriptional regulator [Dehalococcoides mccartyi]AQU05002.1 MerR family transcriptional regulator [Dehalococcoides mccartyi]